MMRRVKREFEFVQRDDTCYKMARYLYQSMHRVLCIHDDDDDQCNDIQDYTTIDYSINQFIELMTIQYLESKLGLKSS